MTTEDDTKDVGLNLAFRTIILQRYVEDNTSDRKQERRSSIHKD